MLFNSYIFWAFFGVVLAVYRRLPHPRQNHLLLAASYIFYGYWDWRFAFLMLLSTVVDYLVAIGIETAGSARARKVYIACSVVASLSLLGFFKYYGFFARELAAVLGSIGISASLPALNVILPVGISFYTFQTMGYTVDVYRGETRAARSFLDFALYVSFFPQLVAGPIERSGKLLPQILEPRVTDSTDFREGLYDIVSGLFRKVVIADNLAPLANAVFAADPSTLSGAECLMGVYAFAFQIYCDFSGYSLIARGIARWMGFHLMQNFRMPYFAASPSDFWSRWHISLSTWLRDYLYIPLGGNRGGKWRTGRNLMLTMILGGLWHGAAWTFVAWGVVHGLMLCAFKWYDGRRGITERNLSAIAYAGRCFLVFQLVCVTWLLFRATSITQAWVMLTRMITDFNFTPFALSAACLVALFAGPLLVLEWAGRRSGDLAWFSRRPVPAQALAYACCALIMLFSPPPEVHEFIYFQF